MSRSGNIVLNILSLAVVGVGIVLIGTFFFPSAFLGSENETVGAESEDRHHGEIGGRAAARRLHGRRVPGVRRGADRPEIFRGARLA